MVNHAVRRIAPGAWSVHHAPPGHEGEPFSVSWPLSHLWFDTWREAMDYADRMTRTRDYELPANMGGFKGANGGEWLVNMWHPDPNCVEVVRYRRGGITQSFRVGWRDLKPLALLLLAWHEKHTTEKDGGR